VLSLRDENALRLKTLRSVSKSLKTSIAAVASRTIAVFVVLSETSFTAARTQRRSDKNRPRSSASARHREALRRDQPSNHELRAIV